MTTREPRPLSIADRFDLWLSTGHRIDGIWIGTTEDDASPVLERIEQALLLIRLYEPRRYRRLTRDLSRIWVRLLPGAQANFNAAAQACQLDCRFVLEDNITIAELASSIVHEAAHARIDRCIPYRADLRPRIEAACRRQELAFAARLPDATAIEERTRAWLAAPTSDEFWSDAGFEQRFVDGTLDALRHLGVPQRVLSLLRRVRKVSIAIRRFASERTRRWSRSPYER